MSESKCKACIHNNLCRIQEMNNLLSCKSEYNKDSFNCNLFIPSNINETWIRSEVDNILNSTDFDIAKLLDKQMQYKYKLDEAIPLLETIVQLYTNDIIEDKETLLKNNLIPRIIKYLNNLEV